MKKERKSVITPEMCLAAIKEANGEYYFPALWLERHIRRIHEENFQLMQENFQLESLLEEQKPKNR